MKCPLCQSREQVSIDLHADGFSHDICECGACGAIWTVTEQGKKIIKGRDQRGERLYSKFLCPTCHSSASIETDLDAFQFHEELHECAVCGTICSLSHDQVEVVEDSQRASFLSSTSDLVEADDYVFI